MKRIITYIGSKTLALFYQNKYGSKEEIAEDEALIINETITKELLDNRQKTENKIPKNVVILIFPTAMLCLINLQAGLEIGLILTFYMIFKRNIPKMKAEKKRKNILKILPYALRQLSTELKAGIGLFDALVTVSNSNYGDLSDEFKFTLNEIQYGTNYIEAFNNLSKRVNANVMDKVVNQIIRTLSNGGNLSDTLNIIANENSENMKIKYQEYSEKLNSLMLLYMFIAVLIPVILFIMIIAATTVMGSVVKPELLLVLYLFFFPMIIIFMIIFIKRLEPTL